MKRIVRDIIAIIAISVILLILSESDNMDLLIELPFVTVYLAYIIGRLVGEYNQKQLKENSNQF